MLESPLYLRKRKYSSCVKKTKEEQEKDLVGLPRHIGPYELIEKLRDGGYSKIYKAKSNYTGDFVAIKAIEKLVFQESVEDVLLMVRQAEVLKILKHRNLVNLYEIYESQRFFYLIMEYLPNGDLIEQIIKKKRFQEQEALAIFSQLVDALYYMHKNEICHRDIRTEKILFDKKNQPKLVGFSYSTFYSQGKKIRESYGSLCYACPEIIQNDYYNPELADVWSLGVVLYVMVCGYLPFSEDDDNENKNLIINGKVDYPPQISNKVKDLLKHMLDIDPNKRYTFQKIVRHPWFKPFDEATLTGGCNPYKMIYPVDERILKLIVIYGFNKKEVDKDLKQNTFNCRTGLYKQLTNKLLCMGFTSFSDLCSEDFFKFSRDEENIITDGEKKYKKYISKILERIKKVERYVEDYKRKEDKIIKDLENIYNDAVKEEAKNKKINKNDKRNKDKIYKNLKSENFMNRRINNNNINQNIMKTKRRTVSSYEIIRGQKALRNIYKNEIKSKNEDDEDFDLLKAFNQENKIKENKFNKNSIILNLEEKDFSNNNHKIKRANSNPNIKDFVQNLIEKDDRAGDLYELDSQLYEENLNVIRNSKRKRQFSVMIRRKKRNYLNTGSENDYFLKKPKDSAERKKMIEDNYKKSIKQIIIEENVNEEKDKEDKNNDSDEKENLGFNLDDKKIIEDDSNKKENKIGDKKSKKGLRFSLSFLDDDEEEEDENSFISKMESKRVSMYDIDEEIKELKEIKNTIKSPLRSSFLKRNTNDNNLVNFNMESNNSIFGEHLDDNIHRKNSNIDFIESINEKYTILTELKKLSEEANSKKKTSKNEEKNKKDESEEKNEFYFDSFGESKNGKNDEEKENESEKKEKDKEIMINKDKGNLIVFDDKLEISFNDEKNDVNTGSKKDINTIDTNLNYYKKKKSTSQFVDYMIYYNDKKKLSKVNIFNQFEDIFFNIEDINSRKDKQFINIFVNDRFIIEKLYISNNDISIVDIDSKVNKINNKRYRSKKNKKTNLNNTLKKEKQNKYNNNENLKFKNELQNSKSKKIIDNKSNNKIFLNNDNNGKNTYNINQLLNEKNNNIINFYNQNDNYNQKIYIFHPNSRNVKHSTLSDTKSTNKNTKNNIIINSNNNTINNISIKNKNKFENYFQPNFMFTTINKKEVKKNKINSTEFRDNHNKSKIKMKLTNNLTNKKFSSPLNNKRGALSNAKKNTNMESYLFNSELLKSFKSRNTHSNKNSEFFSPSINTSKIKKIYTTLNRSQNKNDDNDLKLQKNLNKRFKNILSPFNRNNKNQNISIQKAFHYTILNDDSEILKKSKKYILKSNKEKNARKLVDNKKTNNNKVIKNNNRFINKKSVNNMSKTNSNYSEIYLKKLKIKKMV